MTTYTDSMVASIRAAAPLDIEKAKRLSREFGGTVSHRSVISKAKHLGVEYIKAARPVATRDAGPTKVDMLAQIRAALDLPERQGDLTKAELSALLDRLS